MAKQVIINLSDLDADAMKHVEPARLIDAAINAMAALHGDIDNRVTTLKQVRNAWVLLIGTARLQILP